MYRKINFCRACHNKKISNILNLGKQPLANALLKSIKRTRNEKKIPLELIICEKCKLIQLKHTVKPEILFRNYLWVTGTSKKVHNYRKFFFQKINKYFKKENNFICEIASNDGYFLEYIKKKNKVLGIDPAKNLAKIAKKKGIKTLTDFFNYKTSQKVIKLNETKPNIIICRNVIPHIENIRQAMSGIKNLLSNDGVGIIEFHDSSNIIQKNHYDYIYHEHTFYFTLYSINKVLITNKLYPFDYFKSPISGGSFVIIFRKNKTKTTKRFLNKIIQEKRKKLDKPEYWKLLENKCSKHKKKLLKIINNKSKNKKISAYGASARSSTLLNYLGIDNSIIKKVFDINTLKNGLYTPGSHIKIVLPTEKKLKNTNLIILLAWNFKKEVIRFLKNINFKGEIVEPLPVIKKYKLKK